jgi:hypothetical protein
MSPGPKNAPRLGDVANLARSVDRLDGIERKIDTLLKSYGDLDRRLSALEAKGNGAKR